MIITKTPFRVSLFGGGTDHPDWFNKYGGAVVSMAIDKYCYISAREFPPFFDHKYRISYSKIERVNHPDQIEHPAVREAIKNFLPEKGLEIQHHADLPGRSGLGSSSAFAVGLINALLGLDGQEKNASEIADLAIDLERNHIGETVGYQDQIACALGGINEIRFEKKNKWDVNRLEIGLENQEFLENSMFLVYSGIERISSDISKSLLDNLDKKQKFFEKTHLLALEATKILTSGSDLSIFGEMLYESWFLKKESNPAAISPNLQKFWESGLENGATGGKILGSGGGGFLLFWVPIQKRAKFISSISESKIVPIKISMKGTERLINI
jgi:D-glycero-alpha-D-manno-heptose-7-phosphate kinase